MYLEFVAYNNTLIWQIVLTSRYVSNDYNPFYMTGVNWSQRSIGGNWNHFV